MDYNKYKGHTEGPWEWANDFKGLPNTLMGNGRNILYPREEQGIQMLRIHNLENTTLIADAPLLLARCLAHTVMA